MAIAIVMAFTIKVYAGDEEYTLHVPRVAIDLYIPMSASTNYLPIRWEQKNALTTERTETAEKPSSISE